MNQKAFNEIVRAAQLAAGLCVNAGLEDESVMMLENDTCEDRYTVHVSVEVVSGVDGPTVIKGNGSFGLSPDIVNPDKYEAVGDDMIRERGTDNVMPRMPRRVAKCDCGEKIEVDETDKV